ncbi:amino acid ABC transporter substrate-binding protein [Solibacillus sp. R5-41]|uniref:transporter substrate-binding domain-containing protein n=1 Tax=Solibacillus sp. R5-41 TaxID=2048654 RepID=UPI000C12780A|nr:transporter substrate-binding domain-containing protein [Solibacillus sp. R5-41]ATP39561.1 amino acid ABC transporter substrate-binding protein [Solibacillus sp. R5-41]
MKKMFAALALATLALAACGGEDEATSINKLKEIEDDGVIQIGLEGTFPPFSYHNEAGDLTGFEYEIAAQIAEDLGVKAEFIETKWDSLIAGLDTDKYDFVINNVSITDERKEKYDFSIPYMESVAVLAVNKDKSDITKIEDLDGKKAAQTITSNFAKDAEALGAEIVPATDLTSSIELVLQGRADGTIHDRVTFLTYLQEQSDAKLKIVEGSTSSSNIALILNKDNEQFRKKLNEIIQNRTEDGTFAAISEKYFGENIISND